MQFKFKQLTKGRTTQIWSPGSIRLNQSSLTISPDVVRSLSPSEKNGTRKKDKIYITLYIDKDHDAIKLEAAPTGFAFDLRPIGSAALALSVSVKRQKLKTGEYLVLSDDEPNVFVHSDELSKIRIGMAKDAPPQVGDRVEWKVKPESAKKVLTFAAQGIVKQVFIGKVGKRKGRQLALIEIDSPRYHEVYPNRSETSVFLYKLTIISHAKENE